ncbi:MAG: SSU ribosomal protein S18e (S13p) [Candidatus Fermentimicrarchaeum limneticum]|uniref:Small ribosomal subunit protein uS13 n=1 Tax=Fermentimicrarchaeum limneticum TaxID=2795018 RepID=A0A7D6BT60_FERL1|nr:MAG: SSU ribosomal protein S18e (S13p) [Candidatus Fermentimicrarchaeum limneticum]
MSRKTEKVEGMAEVAPTKEIRGIVRIAGRDIKGETRLRKALIQVKGIGVTLDTVLTKIISAKLGISRNAMIGELSDEQMDMLDDIINNPHKYGVPERMLNRQRDADTNQSMHIIGTDLTFRVKQDITNAKDMNTWKGYRHTYGQKVRGQRTRTTGRTGMTVGVLRKVMLAKAAAARGAEAKGAAPAATEEKKSAEEKKPVEEAKKE